MKLEHESYKNILENLHDGLYFVDKDRIITYWNKAAENISGYTADEVIGRSCSDSILCHVDSDGNSLCTGLCALASTIADCIPREAEIYMHHKDGQRIPVSVRVSALTDSKGKIIGGIELFTDISNRKVNTLRIKELEKMAFLDSLTQLPNRNFIQRELLNRFEEKKRYNLSFGILFVDIDHFKKFNDTYGHDVGDLVLRYVAKTFTSNSRPFDLYGRWGGEEFIGIIRNIRADDLVDLGNRVRRLIASSYIVNNYNQTLQVTVSIGATMAREEDTVEGLIKRADDLLYRSKSSGRNCLTFE
jgi:diguanylate cyclase (GGDEF)-like protein/PAS domain S-box-containing protein